MPKTISISNNDVINDAKKEDVSIQDWATEVIASYSSHKFFREMKQGFTDQKFLIEIAVKAAVVGVLVYFSSFVKPEAALLYGASFTLLMGSLLFSSLKINEFSFQYSDTKKATLGDNTEKWNELRNDVVNDSTNHQFKEKQNNTNYIMKASGAGIVFAFAAFCAIWRGSDLNQSIATLAFAGSLLYKHPGEELEEGIAELPGGIPTPKLTKNK